MPIFVYVQEDTGGEGAPRGAAQPFEALLKLIEDTHSQVPLLSGIDKYDDTVFNALQARTLQSELSVLQGEADVAGCLLAWQELQRLIGFVLPGSNNKVHRTLRFSG